MPLPCIEIETAPHPQSSVIVLHGLGADGNDFVPICEELNLGSWGSVRFIFPNAPERSVTINGGYRMRAWYDILEPGLVRQEDEAGLRASQQLIARLIARECERGVPAARIVLMGFSQGCAMALMTGLRYPERLGALVGLSGYLPLAACTAAERSAANADLPIFLAHGRQDPVVQIARALACRDELQRLGYAPAWHEYGMQHAVCPEEIVDLNRWLLATLDAPGTQLD